jgi:type II secretory pathway pseudopilin PulG
MSTNPYDSPKTASPAPEPPTKRRFTLVELLVVLGVIAILIALLLPMRRSAGEASRRSMCSNNLKQIGIALHNYADEYGAFPPAYTVDAEGKPLHSWRTLILPFIEQGPLYEKIDLSKPWDDPANKEAYDKGFPCINVPRPNWDRGRRRIWPSSAPTAVYRPPGPGRGPRLPTALARR